MNVRPTLGDTRGLIHKSKFGRTVGGAVGGFIKGGPIGAVTGGVKGFVGGGVSITPSACPPGFDPTAAGGCAPRQARVEGGAFRQFTRTIVPGRVDTIEPRGGAPVTPVPGVRGFFQRRVPGGATGFEVGGGAMQEGPAPFLDGAQAPGLATIGRFGAAVEPSFRSTTIRDCPRGMVLAVDSLCYSRRDVRNSERFWPRGRRPLLTGGEMRAISTAASAAKKLQRKQKDLMALGLLPKPTARRKKAGVTGHKATLTHA